MIYAICLLAQVGSLAIIINCQLFDFGMDYCVPDRRKTKGDKRAKSRYMRYKLGGRFRSANIFLSGKKEKGKK